MRRLTLIALLSITLAGCGGGGGSEPAPATHTPRVVDLLKSNMAGQVFEIPQQGSLNYVTVPTGPITGKTRIVMRYRIEAADGTKILPKDFPTHTPLLTLHFQRAGDTLTGQGPYEAYRWYATFATQRGLKAGSYEAVARFDENWTALLTSSRQNNPQGFADAMANAERVGFVLGGGDGYGHGVYATGPARIVVESFEVL